MTSLEAIENLVADATTRAMGLVRQEADSRDIEMAVRVGIQAAMALFNDEVVDPPFYPSQKVAGGDAVKPVDVAILALDAYHQNNCLGAAPDGTPDRCKCDWIKSAGHVRGCPTCHDMGEEHCLQHGGFPA